jgi:branched-chain amino acid transport system ATP-binding protein
MMTEPRVVLLDEPAAGVNRTLLHKLTEAIHTLNEEKGYTFVVIEHDMEIVAELCHPVIVMAQGRVLAEGAMADIRANPAVIEAYLGVPEDA